MKNLTYFTSEFVSPGHPDKVSDQISDAVVDACLADDPNSRVACEVFCTTGQVVVGGEITTTTYIDIQDIVRSKIDEIGYKEGMGFDSNCGVLSAIHAQSPDIAMGVDIGGAGDQGIMFGGAVKETPELMPLALVLGTDPVSGKPVSVKIGRFGPVIQIGTADDEEKPRFAQLAKGLSMETITLEEALDAFKLPRTLGDYDGHTVTVGVGRFGPYVRYDKLFVSIPKGTDPMEISLDEAVELIKNKIEAQEKKFIKVFDADPDMQVLNGRYGPYISYQKKNYKIPENVEPADLSLEACFKVIELQKSKAETRKTKAASRNRGTVNMEEESEKPEESAKSKAASKVKGTAKAKK